MTLDERTWLAAVEQVQTALKAMDSMPVFTRYEPSPDQLVTYTHEWSDAKANLQLALGNLESLRHLVRRAA